MTHFGRLLLAGLGAFVVPTGAAALQADSAVVEEIAQALGPGGNAAAGRMAIRELAAAATPDDATLWIQLLAVAEGVGPEAGQVSVRAVALGFEDRGGEGAQMLVGAVPDLPADDGAPVVWLASLLAEEENPSLAAELRERFLDEYPEAPERPVVMLRHARWLLSIFTRRGEGVALLEELIVAAPDHPVTPDARRLYQMERARSG